MMQNIPYMLMQIVNQVFSKHFCKVSVLEKRRKTMSDNILIVDDEQRIIDLARMYIEQEGFRVESATDGRDALEKILADEPALVVLDLMLPGMGGLEVCR